MSVVEPRPPAAGVPHRQHTRHYVDVSNSDGLVSERRTEIERNRERRHVEGLELAGRDLLEDDWMRDIQKYKALEGVGLNFIETTYQQHHSREDILHEEATDHSLLLHSEAASQWRIDSQRSITEDIKNVFQSEQGVRDNLQLLESNYRRQITKLCRDDWLHSRGKELNRTQPELDVEEETLTEQLLEELRLSRLQHLQMNKEIEEAEEASESLSKETINFINDLCSEESYLRTIVESDELTGCRELMTYHALSAAFVGEAVNRVMYEETWLALWKSILLKLYSLHYQNESHERSLRMKEFTQEEHASWLQHRKRETDRQQEDQYLEEASLEELRRQKSNALEKLNSSVLSYYRAEADDRSLILSKQLWSWRDIVDCANHAMKESILKIITRQVESEYMSQVLTWTPELWRVLEDDQMDKRQQIQQDDSDERTYLESEEIRSFLRTRNMELQKEAQAELLQAQTIANQQIPVPEPPPSLAWIQNEHIAMQQQIVSPMDAMKAHEEQHAQRLASLRDKWTLEENQAAELVELNKKQRAITFEKNIKALRTANHDRMLSEDRKEIESSEERKRSEIESQQRTSWDQIAGISRRPSSAPPPPKKAAADEVLADELFGLWMTSQTTKRALISSQQDRHRQVLQTYYRDTILNELYLPSGGS